MYLGQSEVLNPLQALLLQVDNPAELPVAVRVRGDRLANSDELGVILHLGAPFTRELRNLRVSNAPG